MGVFVHLAADAVAAEVGGHAAVGLAGDRADGMGDVADAVAGGGGGDAGVQGLLGGGDEFEVGGAGVPMVKLMAASPVQPSSSAPQSMLTRSPSRRR